MCAGVLKTNAGASYKAATGVFLVQLEMQRICTIGERAKQIGYVRMIHRFAGVIGNEVLFRHIGHIIALVIFSQKMVERLVFDRPTFLGDGIVPFICICKFGIHVKNHPSKGMFLVADDLSKVIFSTCSKHNCRPYLSLGSVSSGFCPITRRQLKETVC